MYGSRKHVCVFLLVESLSRLNNWTCSRKSIKLHHKFDIVCQRCYFVFDLRLDDALVFAVEDMYADTWFVNLVSKLSHSPFDTLMTPQVPDFVVCSLRRPLGILSLMKHPLPGTWLYLTTSEGSWRMPPVDTIRIGDRDVVNANEPAVHVMVRRKFDEICDAMF
jgi:hypothetical protein